MAPQTTQHQKAYNCKDGPDWSWSQEKQFWCCFYQTRGCWPGSPPPGFVRPTKPLEVPATTFPLAPTTTTTYFQCLAEDWNIERRMSANEKQWCCRHRGYGCPTTTTTTSTFVVLTTSQEEIESTNSTNFSVNATVLSDGIRDIRARFATVTPWTAQGARHSADQAHQTLSNFFPQMKFDANHVRLAWSQRTWTIALASAACALCALRALLARPSPRNRCCHLYAKLKAVLDRSRRCGGYLSLDAAAAALDRGGEMYESTSPQLLAALQQDCTDA